MKKNLIAGAIAACLIANPLIANESNSYRLNSDRNLGIGAVVLGVSAIAAVKVFKVKNVDEAFALLFSGTVLTAVGTMAIVGDALKKAGQSQNSYKQYSKLKRKLRYTSATNNLPHDKSLLKFVSTANFEGIDNDIDKVKKVNSMLKDIEIVAKDIVFNANSDAKKVKEAFASEKTQTKLADLLGNDSNTQNLDFANRLLSISVLGTL